MSTNPIPTLLTNTHLEEIYSLLSQIGYSENENTIKIAKIVGHEHFRLLPSMVGDSILSLTLQIGNWIPGLDGGVNGSFFEILVEKTGIAALNATYPEDAYSRALKGIILSFGELVEPKGPEQSDIVEPGNVTPKKTKLRFK